MNHARDQALIRRQQALLKQSAVLRQQLGTHVQSLRAPLSLADQTWSGVEWLREHPLLPLATLALLALRGPRRMLGLATRMLWGWGLFKRVKGWLA